MSLHLLHGCTTDWARGRQSCRNFVPEERLCRFLEEEPRKYASWQEDADDPHVLTLDDSTRGAARACELARTYGHEVTLFVNPFHVATGAPYFFTLLDAALDARTIDSLTFRGMNYDLRNYPALRAFRLAAKHELSSVSYTEAISRVYDLSKILRVNRLEVEDHAQILCLDDLIRLRNLGVSIENHGWYHDEIAHLGNDDFVNHISQARDWFSTNLGVASKHYAVPFGVSHVGSDRRDLIEGIVWLAHPGMPEGKIGLGHWNRTEITFSLQAIL